VGELKGSAAAEQEDEADKVRDGWAARALQLILGVRRAVSALLVKGHATVNAIEAGPSQYAVWIVTARLLSLPGLLAGASGLVVWSMALLKRASIGVPHFMAPLFLGAMVTTSVGSVVGLGLFLIAFAVMVVLGVVAHLPLAERLAGWRMVLAGFLGTVIAWSAYGFLL
jgi:hypothetical protein